MEQYVYAQLDINDICVGISNLSGLIDEYQYFKDGNFKSRMIKLDEYREDILGKKYENGEWV